MSRPLAILLVVAGCGGERPPAAPPAPAAGSLRAAAAGRMVVAEVNGEPIYHDCVARQAAGTGKDRRAALDDCIRFELLAQEALRRGYLADPEVARVRRTEMVRGLIDAEYTPTIDEPSDVPAADIEELWKSRLQAVYNKPERRRATYCRVGVKKKTPRGGERDLKAKAYAEQIHRAMTGLRFTPELLAFTCHLASGGRKVRTTTAETEPFSATGATGGRGYAREFADAAFSIDQVGQVSRPTRTEWGWDIVLLTEILPPEKKTLAEAEPEIRAMLVHSPTTAEYRVEKFMAWFGRKAGAARVEVHPELLPAEPAVPAAGAEAAD